MKIKYTKSLLKTVKQIGTKNANETWEDKAYTFRYVTGKYITGNGLRKAFHTHFPTTKSAFERVK